jgi:O-antigen/teichoic acid export membrane protein
MISVVIGLLTIITGFVFTIILTRTLDPVEFGTWGVIIVLFMGVLNIEPIISYWATREVARGLESAKTAIFSSGIFSSMAVIIYLIIVHFVHSGTDTDFESVFFAAFLIPIIFLNKVLAGINLGWKPQAVSYGILVMGVTQIPMALIFVYFFDMGVIGIIISVAIANISSIIVLTISARETIKKEFQIKFLKKWFRLSWLPFYPGIAGMVHAYDVVIFALLVGSVEGVGFWTAAVLLPNLISNSGLISTAVYAKLLQKGKMDNLQRNVTQIFFFAFPLSAIVIVFAEPGLFILNPIYQIAFPVVIIMTFQVVLNTLSTVFQSMLKGVETVDVDEKASFKQYIKSKLFLLPTLLLIQYSIYITLLVIMLWVAAPDSNLIDLITYWAIIMLSTQIPMTIWHYIMIRKHLQITFELSMIFKYFAISLVVFGLIYYLTEQFLEYDSNVFVFIPNILLFIIIGIFGYISITYLVDSRTKQLVSEIINELKERF